MALLAAVAITQFASPIVEAQGSQQQSTSDPIYALSNQVCGGVNGRGGIIDPSRSIFNVNNSAAQSLLTVSLAIMLIFALVAGALYAIGHAFKFRLVEMAKSEINEIIITVLIVLVFVGTFAVGNAAIGPNSHLFAAAGSNFNNNVFISDCAHLYYSGYQILVSVVGLNSLQKIFGFFYEFKLSIMPSQFGIVTYPFIGVQTVNAIISLLSSAISGFMLIMVAAAVLIGIIYTIFPLFLYVGIVLRTIPWTRAAGGSFLGVFLGFYIVFPLLLYSMLGAYNVVFPGQAQQLSDVGASTTSLTSVVSGSATSTFNPLSILNLFGNLLSNAKGGFDYILSQGTLQFIITQDIQPFAYVGFALVISFIISFDFLEAAGDMLGAPSLTSENMLKKII